MIELILIIIRAILGFAFGLFIPGYLAALLFFKELKSLEKVTLGFILSICIDIIVGLILGYNEQMKDLTGGITATNLWIITVSISVVLALSLILKHSWPEIDKNIMYLKVKSVGSKLLKLKPKMKSKSEAKTGNSDKMARKHDAESKPEKSKIGANENKSESKSEPSIKKDKFGIPYKKIKLKIKKTTK